MKNPFNTIAPIIIGLLVFVSGVVNAGPGENLLQNWGFEDGLEGWSICKVGNFTRVGYPVKSGDFAASLSTISVIDDCIYQTVAVVPGGTYNFSGWAIRDALDGDVQTSIYLQISWCENEDPSSNIWDEVSPEITYDDEQYAFLTTGDVEAPTNTHWARLKAVLDMYDEVPATAYFDDLSFIGTSPTPTPTLTPQMTPIPTPTATTTIPPTPTGTSKPTPLPTSTSSPTPTSTLTPTPTGTQVYTPTPTDTQTPTPTPSQASTATPTLTPIATDTPAPTDTPIPTTTPTPIPTDTPTPALTPTATTTPTISPTATSGGGAAQASTPTHPPTPTLANEGDIVINEVQYDPIQGGTDAAFEWFELYNSTSQTYLLKGWGIADNYKDDPIPDLLLEPGGFVIIAAGAGFYDSFPNYDGQIAFIADGRIGNGLNNNGDNLRLIDSTGRIIDSLSYGSDTSEMLPPCANVRQGHTLERLPAGIDTNTASDFIDNEVPSPGSGLATTIPIPTPHASPQAAPSTIPSTTQTYSETPTPTPAPIAAAADGGVALYAATTTTQPMAALADEGDVVINEVQYDTVQEGMDTAFEWFELYNRTSKTYVLNGWRIADNQSNDLIPSLVLAPGGFVIIAAGAGFYDSFPNYNGQIAFIADGRIGNGLNNDGDSLCLTDSTERVIDTLSYGTDTSEILPPCCDVIQGHTLERRPAGIDTNTASDFVDNEVPSPGYGLASATPTPTPYPSPSPTQTPSPSITPVTTHTTATASTGPAEQTGTPAELQIPTATISSTPGPTSTLTPSFYPDMTVAPEPATSSHGNGSNSWWYVGVSLIVLVVVIALLIRYRLSKRG